MLVLATDLDGTFLAGISVYKQQLYKVLREREDVLLIFVTGRGLESVEPLLNHPVIPNPDYIICDVGATIVNGLTLQPVQPLQEAIENKWPGQMHVYNKLKDVRGLKRQDVPQMRRCSFFYDATTDIAEVNRIAVSLGCDVLLSAEQFVDILPAGINKGHSLQQLVALLNIPEQKILVAGDTLNDLSLYHTGYKGVVVGGAENKLLEATRQMDRVFQADDTGCGGILQAMDHFHDFRSYLSKEANKEMKATVGKNSY